MFFKVKSFQSVGIIAVFFALAEPVFVQAELEPKPAVNQEQLVNQLLDAAFAAYVDRDYQTAMVHFKKVLELNPRDEAAFRGLEQCQKHLGKKFKDDSKYVKDAKKFISKDRWLDAIDIVNQLLEKNPGHPLALELRTDIETDLTRTLHKYEQGSIEYRLYSGVLAYLNRNYVQCLEDWGSVANEVPKNKRIQDYIQHAQTARDEMAQKDLETNGLMRADQAFSSGNMEAAQTLYLQLMRIFPDNKLIAKRLAEIADAKLREKRQKMIGSYYDAGVDLFQQKKYAESLAEWENILSVDPGNEVAKGYIGRIAKLGVTKSVRGEPVPALPPSPTEKIEPSPSENLQPEVAHFGDAAAPTVSNAVLAQESTAMQSQQESEKHFPSDSLPASEFSQDPALDTVGAANFDPALDAQGTDVSSNLKEPVVSPQEQQTPPENAYSDYDNLNQPLPRPDYVPPIHSDPDQPLPHLVESNRKAVMNYVKGIRLYKNREYVESIQFFENYLKNSPEDSTAMEWLRKVHQEQDEKAQEFYNRGLLSYAEGDVQDAVFQWQQALKVYPNHARTLKALHKVRGGD